MIIEPRHSVSTEAAEGQDMLSVKALLHILWRRLWIILLVAVVLAGMVVALDMQRPPQYQASIKILIGQKSGIAQLPQDWLGLVGLTTTLTEVVVTRPVAEDVVERLDLQVSPEILLAGLTAEQIPDTQLIQVSYTGSDPKTTQRIVNATGTVFSDRVSDSSSDDSSLTATVLESAAVPDAPVSPNPLRDGLLALMVGSMLGIGLALLVEYLDDRWRSPEEAEQVSGVPTLGVVPEFEIPRSRKRAEKKAKS